MLFHFSEDPGIERFTPHVPATNLKHPPAVWAVDAEHSPLYWFPRDCPRAAVWNVTGVGPGVSAALPAWAPAGSPIGETARRVHTVERAWERRLRTTAVFRYELPHERFAPWPDADGQFIATETVVPERVEALGDLVALHQAPGIELR